MSERSPLEPKFEALLDYLKQNRGFDFTGYKRSSLKRRVSKRLGVLEIEDFTDYIDFLQVHPSEFETLFNTILINVTSFFRDVEAWDYLRDEIIPRIIKHSPDQLRIWSAGCASGQEAYSIAMLMCEALGVQEFHRSVKIYATDVDEEALVQARQAQYTQEELERVPEDLREKYFAKSNGRFAFRSDIRRAVIFGRHDLVQDAPISHLDMLLCRNILMYLNAETQSRILSRMHYDLKETGFLFLGKAEMLLSHSALFEQVDLSYRVFSKVMERSNREQLFIMAQNGEDESSPNLSHQQRVRDLAIESLDIAQIAISRAGVMTIANVRARTLFDIKLQDLGRPFNDLELSYRPFELRSLIEQACSERQPVAVRRVPQKTPNATTYLDIKVIPLITQADELTGVTITFDDVTEFSNLNDELLATHEELETTNEELQSTNEELETTNEELQSTNEELETTNEELQSTNEELETTNEELQSANEELEATNEELRLLMTESHDTNTFLHTIVASLQCSMIVLDRQLRVRVWNQTAVDVWGVRGNEALSKPFGQLDFGLPVDEILPHLGPNVAKNEPTKLRMVGHNRLGRKLNCSVTISRLQDEEGGFVILVDENLAV